MFYRPCGGLNPSFAFKCVSKQLRVFHVRLRKGGHRKGNKRAPLNVPSLVGNYKKEGGERGGQSKIRFTVVNY